MSTATACNLPYFEDAGLNAAAILQQQIFRLQVDQFQSVSTFHENQSSLNQCNDLHISELLLVPSRKVGHSRCLDNEEITLLGLLDSDGRLTLSSRMTEFMIMMTRVSRMDHRALLVEILTSQTSESCEKQFVSHGGLRLLKLWIKIAEEENNLHELIALVKLCRKLPFDEKAIKETGGLGKSIRKLLKFKHSSPDLNTLFDEIRGLVGQWTQQAENAMNLSVQKAAVVKVEDSIDAPQIAVTLSEKLVQLRGKEAKEEIKTTIQETSQKTNVPADEKSSLQRPNPVNEAKPKPSDNKAANNIIKQSLPPLIEKVFIPGDMTDMSNDTSAELFNPSLASTMELLALHSVNHSNNNIVKTLPTAQPAAVREKKVADMAEGARKLLAIKAQAQSKNLMEVDPNINNANASTEIVPPVVIKALRSAMKKSSLTSTLSSSSSSSSTITTTSAEEDLANKEKKTAGIRWADEHGLSLREVHTIEVEKIKNTVASYKSHRDLVRKERQLEKDTHLSKVHDAMQRTAAWRTPKPLNVSIEVLTNREGPVTSQEKDLQTRRLGLVLEVRYLDDSLIPSDPDDSLATATSLAASQDLDIAPPKLIPWMMPGVTDPVDNYPSQHQEIDIVGNNGPLRLPRSLQQLDPQLLQRIVTDPQLLQSLLNPDNTINEHRVLQLQLQATTSSSSSSSGGYMNTIHGNHLNTQQQQQRFGYDRSPDMDYHDSNNTTMNHFYGDRDTSLLPSSQGYNNSRQSSQGLSNGFGRISRFGEKVAGFGSIESSTGVTGTGGGGIGEMGMRARSSRWGDKTVEGSGVVPLQSSHGMFDEQSPSNFVGSSTIRYGEDNNMALGGGGVGGWGENAPSYREGEQMDINGNSGNVGVFLGQNQRPKASGKGFVRPNKFPSAKASVPCRFFNTRKGCQFGDKCEFGHFVGVVPGSGPILPPPTHFPVGSEVEGRPNMMAGPGSRQHFKGIVAGGVGGPSGNMGMNAMSGVSFGGMMEDEGAAQKRLRR